MANNAVRLSFDEAFAEALEETELAGSDSLAPASAEPEVPSAPEAEQLTVETEGESSLFEVLAPESADDEQPSEDSYEVKVNGVKYNVSLQELINGYQRQADYTQGKQKLAEQEKMHENAITLWEALEADFVGTVQKLMSRSPGAFRQGPQGPKAAPSEEEIDALVERKLQEKLASDPRIQQMEQEHSLRQIEQIFADIEEDFSIKLSRADKQAVLERAQYENTVNLHLVVAAMLKEREQKLAEKRNLELVSTAQGRRSGDQSDYVAPVERYMSPKAAWEAALAEEGNLQ